MRQRLLHGDNAHVLIDPQVLLSACPYGAVEAAAEAAAVAAATAVSTTATASFSSPTCSVFLEPN